jgi:hypothetical protein
VKSNCIGAPPQCARIGSFADYRVLQKLFRLSKCSNSLLREKFVAPISGEHSARGNN